MKKGFNTRNISTHNTQICSGSFLCWLNIKKNRRVRITSDELACGFTNIFRLAQEHIEPMLEIKYHTFKQRLGYHRTNGSHLTLKDVQKLHLLQEWFQITKVCGYLGQPKVKKCFYFYFGHLETNEKKNSNWVDVWEISEARFFLVKRIQKIQPCGFGVIQILYITAITK